MPYRATREILQFLILHLCPLKSRVLLMIYMFLKLLLNYFIVHKPFELYVKNDLTLLYYVKFLNIFILNFSEM
jgi:hypothetical protein